MRHERGTVPLLYIKPDKSVGVADMSLCGRSVGTETRHRPRENEASRERTCFAVCLQSASVERTGDSSCIRGAMMPSCPPSDPILMLNLRLVLADRYT